MSRHARGFVRSLAVFRGKYLLGVLAAVLVITGLTAALVLAELAGARSSSTASAEAAAQSQRIDHLDTQVRDLTNRNANLLILLGRQKQAIDDLGRQLQHAGQKPVASNTAIDRTPAAQGHAQTTAPTPSSSPAPQPAPAQSPARTSSPKPKPAPAPSPSPTPAPSPSPSPIPVCVLGICL